MSRRLASRRNRRSPVLPLQRKLALNQWFLRLLGVGDFDALASHMRDEGLEGLDEDNVHKFHHVLVAHLSADALLDESLLLEYDQNIVRHTQALNRRRLTNGDDAIVWRYFQYLMLLATEIYMDRYFSDAVSLRSSLNEAIARTNLELPASDRLSTLDDELDAWSQLNKVSFWSATGSGKTLIMHMNILQYRHHLEKSGRARDLNRIILLTPNEGLSKQHVAEFQKAGIEAELFSKDAPTLFDSYAVEVIDIHKLRDEMGARTIAVDSFEDNNLVLIDEGHRGASSGVEGTWMRFRNILCERGFSFEYSATFGQAVKGSSELSDLYAKSILFDYSYRFFYGDGFGKDYHILNLEEGVQDAHLDVYLVACLLTFYQQVRLYTDEPEAFRPFRLEKPLWVFVGGKVTATLAARDASDIIEILKFLARYLGDRGESIRQIQRVLDQGVVTAAGANLFAGRFSYLATLNLTAEEMYSETLGLLFNSPGGGTFTVENLRGAPGEIALRVGDSAPFGVINVGDANRLVRLCEDHAELFVTEREFSDALFDEINGPESTVNILIGSKKFSEGWNSWRVSTMGLMNVGATEGSQIIQLFGRGVRLRGMNMSLKRSSHLRSSPDQRPQFVELLETLSIFGIRADYMAQFRDFLTQEGIRDNSQQVEFLLPVVRGLGTTPLKMIRLRATEDTPLGRAFQKRGPLPSLSPPDPSVEPATEYLRKNQVVVNWYPKVQAMKSEGLVTDDGTSSRHATHFTDAHVAFLNMDAIFSEVQRFKCERGWFNLSITKSATESLLRDTTWYRIEIPPAEMELTSFEQVHVWQELAVALLKKYVERYYSFRRREWEMPRLEYRNLSLDDPNFGPSEDSFYRVLVEESQQEIVSKLHELKVHIEAGDISDWEFHGLKALWFNQHLYRPLLYLDRKIVEVSPVPLNKGEYRFVDDLRSFHDAHADFFTDKTLYLLRNLSRGRGVGFFEAGNFYPDFIVWLISENGQDVAFVDPKGIRNVAVGDPKIVFHESIKELEYRLGDSSVHLHSFIVSNTPSFMMEPLWMMSKDEMLNRNVLFQEEDSDTYIEQMLTRITSPVVSA